MDATCDVRIRETGTTINGVQLNAAEPVAWYHALLGRPSRIVAAGAPAPCGHRNSYVHYYDELGITLLEHHFTYQIEGVTIVLDTDDAIFPTIRTYSGVLELGATKIIAGDFEDVLQNSKIQFTSTLRGIWFAHLSSTPVNGQGIQIAISSMGQKLTSGRRSRKRRIQTLSICLEHDPWDTQFRP